MSNLGGGPLDAIRLFSDYLRLTGVAHVGPEPAGEYELLGKRLGLINGSSWITLWSTYFGRQYLPGVHLINVGNEAVQVNFMEAHARGEPCPPQSNIDAFVRYAHDLVDLAHVDGVLITCSTMNRAYRQVEEALAGDGVPVVQIDRPMMEQAVVNGGRVFVIATHGPTVKSTQALLTETAAEMGREVSFGGITIEEAWERLAVGDLAGHNHALAQGIRQAVQREEVGCVVLAQLSMAVFELAHPNPVAEFGVPVLTSGRCGFQRVRELLADR
ncbi:MAG: aspartate/glutamate racemase family protein [Anaerolineae bacterium]